MRALILVLLFSLRALAQNTCGQESVSFKVTTDKSQHPLPAPEPGKARVFVIGRAPTTSIAMDGKWLGAASYSTYFFLSLDPGLHHLCARAFNWPNLGFAAHSLDAKAGETYYFATRIPRSEDLELVPLDSDEAALLLSQSKFSTSRPK